MNQATCERGLVAQHSEQDNLSPIDRVILQGVTVPFIGADKLIKDIERVSLTMGIGSCNLALSMIEIGARVNRGVRRDLAQLEAAAWKKIGDFFEME